MIDTAIALADEEGLDAVSMRSVAAELDVVPMALYKHVDGKEDLIAGMIDAIVSRYPAAPAGQDWRDAVRGRVLGARDELGIHPWLRTAIESATRRTPAVLAYMDALAGEFAAGGVSYDLTHYAMHALGHRIWGFSPEAFATSTGDAPPPDPETVATMMRTYPHVVAIAQASAASNPSGACDEDAEFEFTLDLLLESFERLHRSGWTSGSVASPRPGS
ncbi:TetR/AcrR family transcriptional regulator [Microbacterium mangrovi]|uniref:TetR/AcrR family transcriptional regulator n=1 Tax=Microbacterium mangrovi TaxID=1348253 RepID=UPI001E2ADFAD|nr:TetR/AcrR family transcriptional regulator [Microbacterium mangrovi]